jgi:recombination protein RecR
LTDGALARLMEELARLPGVGPKTAQRYALHLLRRPREEAAALAAAIIDARERVHPCSVCHNLTDEDPCAICRSPNRDHGLICVVEEAKDVAAMEKTREYRGVYHVLQGAIDILGGVGPDDLRVRELLARVKTEAGDAPHVREVILATDPDVEGDATAIYLGKLLKQIGVRVTRIARGVPEGGDLDYVDEVTLARALVGRSEW